jgi:O-antigen/teichoic acid export membrane protein
MRRDVLSAYAASGAKVLSWVIISAVVFRESWLHYGFLALVRGTVGLLNYTTLGLAPAMMRLLAAAAAAGTTAAQREDRGETFRRVYAAGLVVAAIAGIVGLVLTFAYCAVFDRLHDVPVQIFHDTVVRVVFCMGLGAILRLTSEAPAAVVQMKDRVALDNLLVLAAELAWPAIAVGFSRYSDRWLSTGAPALEAAAVGYGISGALLFVLRALAAEWHARLLTGGHPLRFEGPTVARLLTIGSLVAIGQLADFLYAPIDYVLINRLISPGTVSRYAPAVQIDAGLLLLVGALSVVLLPKSAMAHGARDVARLRRYYVKGTLASAALLLGAGLGVYLFSGWIFRLWLGDPMPQTQAILPLVLIHTVVGGSAGVGRAILLGMGKVKPFAVAALVAGAANVVLSFVFVRYFGLGLPGIVYGTIVAVIGRCVLWQPWYVLRTLRREAEGPGFDETSLNAVPPEPL